MGTLLQDIRYAWRTLSKSPAFACVAILTLALGIGANAAMFSIVEGVLLAPLPYRQPSRLVLLLESNKRFSKDAISYLNFQDWRKNSRSFTEMAAVMVAQGFDLTAPGTPEHLNGDRISSGYFQTLGENLILGREFSPEEDRAGGTPAVIISSRLWRERYASNPRVLGQSMSLDGVDRTIIGVAPFDSLIDNQSADVYTPVAQDDPLTLNSRAIHDSMFAIARLKPGITIDQAQEEMSGIQAHLDQLYPDADAGLGADVLPLKEELVGDSRGILLLLFCAVGLVLLIACANIANLLLARTARRTREFAIRAALGASRTRMARLLITESLILSLWGGVLGVALAKFGVRLAQSVMPLGLPRAENIGVNIPVLGFAFGVSVLAGILFALAPARKSSKVDPYSLLKEGGRGSSGGRQHAQSVLVITQMALTLALLAGGGLLLRTIRNLREVNPGFDPSHLIAFKVGLSPTVTNNGTALRVAFLQLLDRIRAIPGVRAADFTMLVPLSGGDNDTPFWIGSDKPAVVQNAPRMLVFPTGPDYLRTMKIPLLRGRFFTAQDTTKTPCVTVIDSVFAQSYFPSRDPVGQTLTFGFPVAPWGPCAIVGVVGHVKHWGLGERNSLTKAQSYYPIYQAADKLWPSGYSDMHIIVRTNLDTAGFLTALKSAVYAGGDGQTVYNVQSMSQVLSDSMSAQRFPMILLDSFAGLALLLASVGLYGVVSYSVTMRIHEFGIRMALGAGRADVFRMVIGEGLRLALAGALIGGVGSLMLGRLLLSFSHLLYGVRSSDPATFVAVTAMLTGVAVLACYIPARHAMRVDPMVALRYE
ncbi:MAG TPA: ABC transporter permease [Verrucomicrobiae bacterium]|nr:ABC transporter permease [Verrucomicrobiae bacterium]